VLASSLANMAVHVILGIGLRASPALGEILNAKPYLTQPLTREYLQHIADWVKKPMACKITYRNNREALMMVKEITDKI